MENLKNMKNMKMPKGGGPVSGLGGVLAAAGLGLYGVSNCLFNVEGGKRAIVFNRVGGIKDQVSHTTRTERRQACHENESEAEDEKYHAVSERVGRGVSVCLSKKLPAMEREKRRKRTLAFRFFYALTVCLAY